MMNYRSIFLSQQIYMLRIYLWANTQRKILEIMVGKIFFGFLVRDRKRKYKSSTRLLGERWAFCYSEFRKIHWEKGKTLTYHTNFETWIEWEKNDTHDVTPIDCPKFLSKNLQGTECGNPKMSLKKFEYEKSQSQKISIYRNILNFKCGTC